MVVGLKGRSTSLDSCVNENRWIVDVYIYMYIMYIDIYIYIPVLACNRAFKRTTVSRSNWYGFPVQHLDCPL